MGKCVTLNLSFPICEMDPTELHMDKLRSRVLLALLLLVTVSLDPWLCPLQPLEDSRTDFPTALSMCIIFLAIPTPTLVVPHSLPACTSLNLLLC